MDAVTGQIVAANLTSKEVNDAAKVGPLLDQVAMSVASFTLTSPVFGGRGASGSGRRRPACARPVSTNGHRGGVAIITWRRHLAGQPCR